MILQRSTLTAQPQGPVEVDWSNPLTRGLLTLAIPRGDTMYCVAQRRLYTATATRPTVGTSLSGLGQRSVNSTIAFSHLPLTAFDLGDATIAVRQVCSTLLASARVAGFSRSSSVNPAFRIDQNPSSQARPRFGILNNSGASLGAITSGASDPVRFSATQAFTMVTAADATEIRAISEGFVYTPAARTAGTTTQDRFTVGGQSSSTDRLGFDGFVFVAAAWTRALSAAEMAEVDRNIWQLFARPRGRSFVPVGGTAAGTKTSDGALAAQVASTAGTATHYLLHTTAGALSADVATIAGTAVHPHTTTGTLTAADATFAGTADHVAPASHGTTGTLSADIATVAGTANHYLLHTTTGTLSAATAVVNGVAAHEHIAVGALLADVASISGSAAAFDSLYPDPADVRAGVQYGPGGIYVGTLQIGLGDATIHLRSFTERH